MKAVLAGKTGTPTDGMAEGDQVTRTSATELVQNLDVSALDGDTAKALLNKILTSLEDVAKMKSSTTAAEEQNHPKTGSSSPPDEVRRASEILLGMRGVDQSNAASCEDTANIENRNQIGKNETNVPTSSDDLASRTKSAISTLADLCTALRDVEPQVVNEVLPRRYHHLVPSPSAPTLEVQAVPVPGPKASSERTVGTEPPTLPSPAAVAQVPSPKRIFIPGKTAIRPMPDYCRVIFHPSSPDMDNRKRRARTVFSAQQLKRLEEEYKKCSYPDKERRQGVADATGLTEGCVRIWYQNRRAKDHRLKDSERQREGMSVSSTSQPEIILSSRPVEPARLPPSDAAPPITLNRAEEAAMEALVNLSSTTSTETMAAHNPQNNLNPASQTDEALADVDTKSSATESKNIAIGGASKCELVEQNNAANNLQLAMEKTEQPQKKQTDHKCDTNSKLVPVPDSSAIDKPSNMRTVEKAPGASSQPKSQRAMIASLVAQTLRHSEGLDYKRTVVPIAVVNIPIVRVDGNTGKSMDGSGKGSDKMKPVPYVTVATRVPVPNTGDRLGGPKRGDSPPQPTEVVRPATSIGIPFKALQFQNQWTKKSSNLSQRNDSSTTVTAKIQPGVHISNLPRTDAATTRTSTSSSASKVSSFLGFLISDTEASTKQLISSSTPTIQDAKPSEKGCGIDTGKAKVPSSAIPSTIVLRLQPRPTTVTAKPPTIAETELTKDSEKDMDQPTFIIDDCSSSRALRTTDRKRKVSEAEEVNNKDRKVVQTKMWRELTEEKSVAKRTKTATKGSKKSTPSQVIQHSREDNQYGDETQEREIETKEATRGSNTCGEIKQTKLSTTDTKSLTDACTVISGGNALNYKNSHPTTLHYKKGRVCQCHQLQEIIDYCVRKGSEAAKKDTDSCSTTKEAGSLQRPREGKEQAGEPSRQVPRSGDTIPKTWASGTVRHLKITTPISIATTGGLVNVRSFTRVPVGSVRAPPVITNTQYAGSFNRPTPASFRHVNYSKKPCPIPATVIPKSTPAAGQLFMNNHPKATVQLKAARGVRVVVSHPSNNVILPPTPACESAGHTYTTPPTFTRPTVGTVSQHTCGAAAMFRLGSVLKRPNASTCAFRLPLVTKPAQRIPTAATTGYISNGIRFQRIQNRGQLSGQPGAVNRQPPLPQGDGNALRRLQRFTDGFMERHRSTAPSTESRRDDRPPPVKVRRTDM